MIKKITRIRLSVGTNNPEKQVTIYYFFFVPFFKSVKEVVTDLGAECKTGKGVMSSVTNA